MSKTLIIAAASASAGAAVTALLLGQSSRPSSVTIREPHSPTPTLPRPAAQPLADIPLPSAPIVSKAISELLGPTDPSGWFAYGSPGPINDFAKRSAYMSSYDRRMRNPSWVAEHITAESLAVRGGDRKHSVFIEDLSIPEKFRAKLRDYFRSGYDRGHQVPAADAKFSQQAMDETFFLSNMCPQVGEGFNRDYWAHFEDFCRRLTKNYKSVRIITGPLYLPKQDLDGKFRVTYEIIGSPPSVAVPTHFYKVIVAEPPGSDSIKGPLAVGAFVMPNAPIDNKTPLTEFYVPVEVIERASGLDFFSDLPMQRRRSLCQDISCSILVREFQKKLPNR